MVLAASAPVQDPAMLTERPTVDGSTATMTLLPVAPIDRHTAPHTGRRTPVRARQVGPQHRGGRIDDANRIVLGQCVNPSERTQLLRPQHFATVNVANTTHHALVKQDFTNLSRTVSIRQEQVDNPTEVGVGLAEIGTEAPHSRVASLVGDTIRLDGRSIEAHGDPAIDFDRHSHLLVRLVPLLTLAINVPRAGHSEVRMEHNIVVPHHFNVFTVALDLFEHSPGLGRWTNQAWSIETHHGLARKRCSQRTDSPVNSISIRHLV
jgi:hypothetical protein